MILCMLIMVSGIIQTIKEDGQVLFTIYSEDRGQIWVDNKKIEMGFPVNMVMYQTKKVYKKGDIVEIRGNISVDFDMLYGHDDWVFFRSGLAKDISDFQNKKDEFINIING